VAILANERIDQVVTSTLHAARASELSTVPPRGDDDVLDFPLATHPDREPFKVIVLVITAFMIWGGLRLISSILTSLAWVVRRHRARRHCQGK
jgi:hypothetical protein